MKSSIDFLKRADDFKILSETTFYFNFNEYRGGEFEQTRPSEIFAYGVKWSVKLHWIDKGWGDYYYEYYSNQEPNLPEKILIEQSCSSMTGWYDTTETIRYYGEPIFTQSDNWGRKSIIWLSGFEKELELCENKEEILEKIKKIQNRKYFNKKKTQLEEAGFSKIQIKKFFRCKADWKYEELGLKLTLINNPIYPKELFKRLSKAKSNRQFDKIAKNWGLGDLCGFSHPRKTNYTRLIYRLK